MASIETSTYSDDEDSASAHGIRLKNDVDLKDLREGKGIEFTIDEDSLPKGNTLPDESSGYFDRSDIYKNSELFTLGDSGSDSEYEEEAGDVSSFEKARKKMIPVTNDEGVMKRILRPGMGPTIKEYVVEEQKNESEKPKGEQRRIEEDDIQLAYHYTGMQENDNEPFDVTYLRDDRPQKAYLNDEFFPGFKIAIASMREKEVADFLIRHDYAFGKLGCPPRIQPEATLRYKIELVKYWATTELDSYAKMTRDEKRLVPVSKLVKLCSRQREEANKLYNNGDFKGANHYYGKAIRILEDANLQNDSDEELQQRALVKLYLNRSMCAIKLSRWDHAITFSNKALYIDPKNSKALYRKAKAKMEFGDYGQAKKIAQLAHSEYPNDQGIGKLLFDINSREMKEKQREKILYQKMFQQGSAPPLSSQNFAFSAQLSTDCKAKIKEFNDSTLEEMKLTATTYTSRELDALAAAAADLNLSVLSNKEGDEWISLKLRKT